MYKLSKTMVGLKRRRFFEEGRGAFLREVLHIVDPVEYPFILASMNCNYLKPVKLGDRLAVQVWIGEVNSGTASKPTGKDPEHRD